MRVLDLFAGLGGWGSAFLERGHEVVSVDFEPRFNCTITADVFDLKASELGQFEIVLASPPCEKFSVLTIGRNWHRDRRPKTAGAARSEALVWATRILIEDLDPAFFVIENPRAMLRKLTPLAHLERRTVTYCRYGHPTQKPTDLWGGFPPSLVLEAPCSGSPRNGVVETDRGEFVLDANGNVCHISSPRGSTTGIQGSGAAKVRRPDGTREPVEARRGDLTATKATTRRLFGTSNEADLAALRAIVPAELSSAVCLAAEADLEAGLTWRAGQRITAATAEGLFA